jgi:hypothetical protein
MSKILGSVPQPVRLQAVNSGVLDNDKKKQKKITCELELHIKILHSHLVSPCLWLITTAKN